MVLTDFYKGTTKKFEGTITLNSATPNITADTVKFLLKTEKEDTDVEALINESADVTTKGADGTYVFNLTKTITDVEVGKAYYEIVWNLSTGEEYVLGESTIEVLERVEDV